MGIRTIAVYSTLTPARALSAWPTKPGDWARPRRATAICAPSGFWTSPAPAAQRPSTRLWFLSENAEFAQACADAGVVFVGPPPAAIAAMGSKSAAKQLMERAQVPLTPGYHGDEQDAGFLHQQADQIGYPVLIKASAGGGGRACALLSAAPTFPMHWPRAGAKPVPALATTAC